MKYQTPHETGFYKCLESGIDNSLERAIQCNPYPRNTQDSVDFYRGWKEAQPGHVQKFTKKEK